MPKVSFETEKKSKLIRQSYGYINSTPSSCSVSGCGAEKSASNEIFIIQILIRIQR